MNIEYSLGLHDPSLVYTCYSMGLLEVCFLRDVRANLQRRRKYLAIGTFARSCGNIDLWCLIWSQVSDKIRAHCSAGHLGLSIKLSKFPLVKIVIRCEDTTNRTICNMGYSLERLEIPSKWERSAPALIAFDAISDPGRESTQTRCRQSNPILASGRPY